MANGADNQAAPGAAPDPGMQILGLLLQFGGGLAEKVIEVEGDKVKTDQGNTYTLAEALALAQAMAPAAPPAAPPAMDWTPVVVVGGVGLALLFLFTMGRK